MRLANFVPTLDTVVVTAMRLDAGLDRVGFSRRKKAGMGAFIGPEKIKDLRAVQFFELSAPSRCCDAPTIATVARNWSGGRTPGAPGALTISSTVCRGSTT
ncbi:MAG TPA: hypothetical protein VES88_13915 [Gemmatimonadaceae bacterium]|nr:hypothetical protein [Gemmatimonadaceae bacterium]